MPEALADRPEAEGMQASASLSQASPAWPAVLSASEMGS